MDFTGIYVTEIKEDIFSDRFMNSTLSYGVQFKQP